MGAGVDMRITSRRARSTAIVAVLVALTPLAAARATDPAAPTISTPQTAGRTAASAPVPSDNPRPGSCPPLPSAQGGAGTEPQTATGTFPWPAAPAGTNPENYAAYSHTPTATPPVRPANWSDGGGDWKLTSARDTDPTLADNPQQLCGVEGNSVDTAWQVTTGRPDTVIAITDSGIEWCDTSIVDKVYLNRRALPLPEDASGRTKPQLEAAGVHFADADPYDLDNRGVFNVAQYANDPRIAKPLFCKGFISPEDLIRSFGHGGRVGPAGYTEAIAGWNFVDDNNDPYDDVHYDHGTGEAQDSTGAADALGKEIGTCPNCMVLPVRVGQSFIAEGNAFARGVAFAVDSGASVIQEALGSIDETSGDAQAIAYANAHGVPVIASAADEEAEHHNEPGNLPGTIVVNSVTQSLNQSGVPLQAPRSYLAVNGCTNYGGNVAVSVESASCSSEATGKTGGITGLLESEARSLLSGGRLQAYPGLHSVAGAPVALSPTEIRELITMAADDVDFQTAALPFGPPDNYAVVSPLPTTRYPTQPGYDMYTGYGRIDAARALAWLAAGRVPPEASFGGMDWFQTYDPTSAVIDVNGVAAAVRTPGRSFRWMLQYGIGTQPEPGAWHALAAGTGRGSVPVHVSLGPAVLRSIASGLPPVAPGGAPQPDANAFTLRLVTVDVNGLLGMDRRTEYLDHDASLVAKIHPGGSIDGAPTLAPIGPGGTNALIVATSDGFVHAYGVSGSTVSGELPGWPVSTVALGSHSAAPAFASGAIGVPHGTIVGGVAVGDLLGNGGLDVVAADMTGRVYAWTAAGKPLAGFPVSTVAAYSGAAARDQYNRLLPGILGAPALGPLEGGRQLDIVVSSMDRHVYAWRPTGQPVPGWPVLVVDRSKASSIDPVTNKVTFKPG
ncbi:MAG TPA: S8 family serine peptidase, partial [Acidimicrobiales bacterium]